MADFSVKISFGMMRKTMPFLMFRCAIYLGIAVAYVLATGTGAGIGYGIGGFWDDETQLSAAAYGAAGGFGLTAWCYISCANICCISLKRATSQ